MKHLKQFFSLPSLGILVFIFLWIQADPPQAHAAFPGENGKIAFESNRTGNFQIFSMNSDGSGQTNLSNNSFTDSEPDISPDATKIVFMSSRAGNQHIFVMNADGSGVTQLTSGAVTDFQADWSPDGTKIAFVSDRNQPGDCNSSGNCDIYTMNADGSNVTRLTTDPAFDSLPKWSPDGTKIAFVQGTASGPHDIFVMNADGSNQMQLTSFGTVFNGIASGLDWSPDGTKLAFSRTGGGATGDIWVMDANGQNQTDLTNSPSLEDNFPAWSPDGTKITFASNRDAIVNDQIYTMNADGSGVARLTSNSAEESTPDWGRQSVIPVGITVKPGDSQPASVNPNSMGKIPVAILSSNTFDATTVDPTTVKFGATGTEASPTQNSLQDVNGDTLTDMLLQFNTQDTGIVCGTTSVTLTGKTTGGQMISGTVPINTVGCH